MLILLITSGGVSIISLAPVGIASTSFTLIFSLTTEIIKKLQHNKKQKEKAL